MVTIYINSTNAGHCIDLYTPNEDDSEQLKQARLLEVYYFTKWINEHWESLGEFKFMKNYPKL